MGTRTASQVQEELRHARAADRAHSAYLIDGPDGTGKRELAHWLARLLLCTRGEPDPCERCGSCSRSTLDPETGAPRHADWQLLAPDGATFKVEQVRKLQRTLSLSPQEGGRRVGLLLQSDALTPAAANALLKTLEEPPPRTTLILVARSGDALPPTIRSRTLRMRLRAERPGAIARALEGEGVPPDAAWLAAQLGGGSLASARDWLERQGEEAHTLLEALRGVATGSEADWLDLADTFRGGKEAGRERTQLLLDVYEAFAGRSLEAALAGPASRREIERWLGRADRVATARRELARRNLNAQLTVEGLLLELRA